MGTAEEQNKNQCFRSVEKAQIMALEKFGLNTSNSRSNPTTPKPTPVINNNHENNVFGRVSASYPPTQRNADQKNSFNNWFCNDNMTSMESDEIIPMSSKDLELKNPLMCAQMCSEQPVLISETVTELHEPTQLKHSNQSMDAGYGSGMDMLDHHTMGLNVSSSMDTYSYIQPHPICYATHYL